MKFDKSLNMNNLLVCMIMGVCVPRPSALGRYPWPSTLDPSALGLQNIARTNSRIKHITYSRVYLFKVKTLYLLKIFKKLLERLSCGVQNKWKGFSSQ